MKQGTAWGLVAWSVLVFIFSLFLLFIGGLFFSVSTNAADIFDKCLRFVMILGLIFSFTCLLSNSWQHLISLFGVAAASASLAVWLVLIQSPYYIVGLVVGVVFVFLGAGQLGIERASRGKTFLCLLLIFLLQTAVASFLAWKM